MKVFFSLDEGPPSHWMLHPLSLVSRPAESGVSSKAFILPEKGPIPSCHLRLVCLPKASS